MPEITKHESGMLSWADLSTSDDAAARRFYTELFGWTYAVDPTGPDAFYYRALVGGLDVAGLSRLDPSQAAAGVPPHWNMYIAVDDADATAARVTEHGGQVLMAPFEVADAGRMAFLQDPTGAVFCVWQGRKHIGARIKGVHGSLCWAELMTPATDQSAKFYGGVFGWQAESMPMPTGTYTVFKVGAQGASGMLPMPADLKGVPPSWGVYFMVDGCDDTVALALKLGGGVLCPATDLPDVGRFATLRDPQGAVFAVLEPA